MAAARNGRRRAPCRSAWLLVLCTLGTVPAAQALHFDIEVRTSAGPVAGSRFHTAFFGDLTSLGPTLPIDAETGAMMFPGDFSDFEGGPCTTANPGFQAFAGHLLADEELHFRAAGALSYWSPATGAWGPAPAGVEVVLFGAIPPDVLRNYIRDPAGGAAAYRYWENGTRFSVGGVGGPLAAGIARAGSGGAIHTHLDWMITGASPSACGAPAGAYSVALELWSPAEAGGSLKYRASPVLQVVFGHGLSEAQFLAAVLARVHGSAAPPPPEPAPVPSPPAPPPPPTPAPVVTLPASLTPWGPPRRLPWDKR